MSQFPKNVPVSLSGLALCLVVSACGGGDASPPPVPTQSSGYAVDGYLQNAAVLCDADGNGVPSAGEVSVASTSGGLFTFPNGCASGLVVTGGANQDTGLLFTGTLKTPAGSKAVTPLTTLLVSGLTQDQLNAALGLPAGTDVANTDPASMVDGALVNAVLMKKTLAVQQLVQKTSEMLNGLSAVPDAAALPAIYTEVAAAFADVLKGGGKLNSTDTTLDVAMIGNLVKAATERVSKAPTLGTTLRDAVKLVNPGALAGVTAGGLQVQAEAILKSGGAANVTSVTKTQQSDAQITAYVAANKTAMAGTPTAETVNSMSTTLTSQVTSSQSSGGGGGGGVTPPPAGSGTVLLSFDEASPAFSDMGAYGGALPSVEAGPSGGTGNALKILKPVSDVPWGGVFFTVATIPFTADRTTLSARVNSTRAGAVVTLKVEIPGGTSVEVAGSATGAANTWSTVKWDLSAVDLTKAYKVMAITPDVTLTATGQSYFIDNITLDPASAVVPPPVPGAVFLSFDEATPVFTEMGAYGGALPSVEAGPTGGTGNALKILKPVSPDTWGGVFFTTPKIPFTATNKAISARVYSTKAGAVIKFKVEIPGGTSVEVAGAATGAANTWSTVTWDFASVDLTKSYKIMAITPDSDLVTSGKVYYLDEIKVVASGGGGGGVPPPVVQPITIATMDEPGAVLTGFEGCWDSFVVADPAGGVNKVGKVTKPGSGVPFYCGSTVVTVANGGLTPIPFTATAKTMTVRVWSPDAGIPVRLKIEDIADATKSAETEATTTVAGGWQTLTFNFASPAAGTPALNLATSYTKSTIFFDFGKVGTGKTYYFDDITFVTGTGTNTVIVTFDEKNYNNTQSQPSILNGFGGAENSTLVGVADGLPADGAKTGKSARVVKNAGEVWAGTSVQRKPNDAVPTIPFVTGATKMSVRVYSAYPGIRVHMKVEQSGRPDYNSEVDAFTSLTNTWETLTFDFGPAGKHFVPSGPGPDGYVTDPNAPGYQPTAQLDVTRKYDKVNIFFDYGLGLAGYDAMPGTRTYYFDDVKFVGP